MFISVNCEYTSAFTFSVNMSFGRYQKKYIFISITCTRQFQIIRRGLNKRGGPKDNLNINKRRGSNKRGGEPENCSRSEVATTNYVDRFGWISERKGSISPASFMDDWLYISHTCLPSHVFSSFAFLMFSVLTFQEKLESLHSRLRQD